MRLLLATLVLLAAPAIGKDCARNERMTLKIEYRGTVRMVDEAKAASKAAEAEVANAAREQKLEPLVLKSNRISLEPGKDGMEYTGTSSYVLPGSLHARELMAKLAEKKLSPSIALATSCRTGKDD